MWKVCIHLGECICSGGVAFKIIFYHFSSCVEPLSLLEGLALFSGGFELFWSFASGVEPFSVSS